MVENKIINFNPDEWGIGENLAIELLIAGVLITACLLTLIKIGTFKPKEKL